MSDDTAQMDALFLLHEGLPRQGPGSDVLTGEALARAIHLPPTPQVLDLGCGSGASTLVLAHHLTGPITAVDVHPPYLDQLRRAAAAAGLAERIRPLCADFTCLDEDMGTFDLVWSEGAAFIMGFAPAVTQWRPLVRPGGYLVVSDCMWLSSERAADADAYFAHAYPSMATPAENTRAAIRAGFTVVDTLALPQEAWWTSYYDPLKRRISSLRRGGNLDSAMAETIAESEHEMALFEAYSTQFGYVFHVLRRPV